MNGQELREWRRKWGLSQERLAEALGIFRESVSRWETGARAIPSFLPLALAALQHRMKLEAENHDDYEKLIKLAKDVVPNSWNIYKFRDVESCKRERGILNIGLHIYDGDRSREAHQKYNASGHVENIQSMNGVGYVTINFYDYSPMLTETLLHELAHIAVHRFADLRTKSYKRGYNISNGRIIESDSHGEVFNKFLNIIENRAIKKGWGFYLIENRI
jgi:transcriptional regulator with XRE-family HTH domain